jgi:catechol 2,3-dioxygenase-like lactoylglutathione lyase family enzyme
MPAGHPAAGAAAATALAVLLVAACGSSGAGSETKDAIAAAKHAYAKAKASGEDLAPGPCIAERLPGLAAWVADIAHDPRTAADDAPSNQCARFRSGAATHFVELTPDGHLIRAQ